MKPGTVLILAGNMREAKDYARAHGLQPSDWIFLHSQEQLLGLENPNVVRYGTYYRRRDMADMERLIQSRNRAAPQQ